MSFYFLGFTMALICREQLKRYTFKDNDFILLVIKTRWPQSFHVHSDLLICCPLKQLLNDCSYFWKTTENDFVMTSNTPKERKMAWTHITNRRQGTYLLSIREEQLAQSPLNCSSPLTLHPLSSILLFLPPLQREFSIIRNPVKLGGLEPFFHHGVAHLIVRAS